MRTPFILILLVLVLSSFHMQEAELSLRLEKGKEYRQTSHSNSTVIQHIEGQEMKIGIVIKGSIVFLVTAADNDQYELEARYENLGMSMQMPQGTMEFNSDDDNTQNIFSQIMAAIIDKPFKVIMGKKGQVIDVQNMEDLWDNIINQFDKVPEMQREQIKSQLMNSYGNKALKGNMEMITKIFPENAVSMGDEWAINTQLEAGMEASVDTKYKLTDIASDHVVINGNSTIATSDEEKYMEMGGMQLRYDIQGSMTSEIKVDKASGWIIEAKIDQKMKGHNYVKENPQIPNGMKIPMEIATQQVITN